MCWLNSNAGAIQAICAILGIVGLAVYCWLTQGIRKSTVAQQKAAQAPMIMFFKGKTSWAIRNYGIGPAIKIWWKPGHDIHPLNDWYELGALASGDESDLPHYTHPNSPSLVEMYSSGARIQYSDMAGNHYATTGEWKDSAFVQDWETIDRKQRVELRD